MQCHDLCDYPMLTVSLQHHEVPVVVEDDEVAPVPGHIKAIRNEIRKNLNRPIHTEKENQFAHLKEAFENVAQKLGGNAEEDEKTSEPVNV